MAYSTITKPSDYFNTLLWTGDGTSSRSLTGTGFQPDWTWIKRRSDAQAHSITDSVRGVTKSLRSDSTAVEDTNNANGYVTSFDSDGFTVAKGSDPSRTNTSGATYVGWNWLAGGTASSNTDGSITSSVSANTTAGFSIVSYTGNETASQTVGHGLGVKPKMIIVKNRTSAVDWPTWHQSLNTTSGVQKFVKLNTTDAQNNGNVGDFPVEPTSSTFSIGNFQTMNKSGDNIIAYCFAEKKGFSKFGSYTGNGSTDGPFIYTGFKPAFVLKKPSSRLGGWQIEDNKRNTFNVVSNTLFPHLSNAEDSSTAYDIDILSNGFKLRATNTHANESGATYIYMAFAENPLVVNTSGGIPATAR